MKAKYILFILAFWCLNSCEKASFSNTTARLDNASYKKAWEFLEKGKRDSAYFYLNEAKDLFIVQNDSLGTVKCLVNMAIIQEDASDNFGSLETSLHALDYIKTDDSLYFSFLASNYNNLGVVTNSLKDYNNAILFYRKAMHFSNDKEEVLMIKNNLSTTYFNQKQYRKAIALYQELLSSLEKEDDTYARILINFAKAKYEFNDHFNPTESYIKAKAICENYKSDWGLDAVYASLSDYYMRRNRDSAYYYAKKMYNQATFLEAPQDRMEALQKMIRSSRNDSTAYFFEEFHRIDDSMHIANTNAKNQFALIRYEGEKNRLENDTLKLENVQTINLLRQHRFFTTGLVVIFFILIISGFTYLKRRRYKLELEAENAIKSNNLETSKRVHDVVANGLYRMMSDLENGKDVNKDLLLYRLEDLYEKSRAISYDTHDEKDIEYPEQLSDLIRSFDNEASKIFIVGNSTETWSSVELVIKQNTYVIVQELLVNMKKHSQANRVLIKFVRSNNRLNFTYKDDGVFSGDVQPGNGWGHIENRVLEMNGTMHYEVESPAGLTFTILLPL